MDDDARVRFSLAFLSLVLLSCTTRSGVDRLCNDEMPRAETARLLRCGFITQKEADEATAPRELALAAARCRLSAPRGLAEGSVEVDPTKYKACLDALETVSCLMPVTCGRMTRGLAGLNGICSFSDACQDPFYCDLSACPGRCVPRLEPGESGVKGTQECVKTATFVSGTCVGMVSENGACDGAQPCLHPTVDCYPGETCLHCSPEGFCVPDVAPLPPGVNEPCSVGCGWGLMCVNGSCAPGAREGETCLGGLCRPGLRCAGGVCVGDRGDVGSMCWVSEPIFCKPGLGCDNYPSLGWGKCATRRELNALCGWQDPFRCAQGLFCTATFSKLEGTCAKQGEPGEACSVGPESPCREGLFCKVAAGQLTGACAAPLKVGEACVVGGATNQCESMYCSGSGVCTARKEEGPCQSDLECLSFHCIRDLGRPGFPPIACERRCAQ